MVRERILRNHTTHANAGWGTEQGLAQADGQTFGGGGGTSASWLVRSLNIFLPSMFIIHNSAPTGADARLAEIGGQPADRQSQQPAQQRQKGRGRARSSWQNPGSMMSPDPQAVRDVGRSMDED